MQEACKSIRDRTAKAELQDSAEIEIINVLV